MDGLTAEFESDLISEIILEIRGQRFILDRDLAALYGVSTKDFSHAVKRNKVRFSTDFRMQLTPAEKLEPVTNCDRSKILKHSTALPYAFSEHGALKAANILNSEKAHEMSVYVIRAFVSLRKTVATQSPMVFKVGEVERRLDQYVENLEELTKTVEYLFESPEDSTPKRKIGF